MALASQSLDNKSNTSLFCAFELAKILRIENNKYIVSYYRHKLGTKQFELIFPTVEVSVSNSEIRYIIRDQEFATDSKVKELDFIQKLFKIFV